MDETIKALSIASIQKFQKKQYKEAAEGFRTCIADLEKSNDLLDLAEMKNNLCATLIEMNQAEQALEIVTGTDEVFAAVGDQRRQGIALANLGRACEVLKRNEEAITAYEKARDCLRASGEKQMLAVTLRALSDLQLKTGRQYQAVATLQDAYEQNPDGKLKNKFFSKAISQLIKKLTGR